MTCDELERILLSSSVPPGFQEHEPNKPTTSTQHKNATLYNMSQGYREESITQIYREPPVSSGINFFLDLYDDLGLFFTRTKILFYFKY